MAEGVKRRRGTSMDYGYLYVDNGCEVAPSCLSCPLEFCKYDAPPKPLTKAGTQARYADIRRLAAEGMGHVDISRTTGASERTVYRVLKGSV